MEEKKRKRKIFIGLLIAFAVVSVVLLSIVGILFAMNANAREKAKNVQQRNEKKSSQGSSRVTDVIGIAYKPIIYLYPTEETKVSVELGNPEQITCSYPKYIDGWNVIAKPNGDLKYIETERNLYSLYYESENIYNFGIEEEGFVVKRDDIANFLEEKLEILGLTEREAEEFIVYWLPKLEENEYNYIRFATMEEIEKNMPLTIDPKPDTLIRIIMAFKGLDEPIQVKEQQLERIERTGFVTVEWGGTEIK